MQCVREILRLKKSAAPLTAQSRWRLASPGASARLRLGEVQGLRARCDAFAQRFEALLAATAAKPRKRSEQLQARESHSASSPMRPRRHPARTKR
jgi:hypothetical protein